MNETSVTVFEDDRNVLQEAWARVKRNPVILGGLAIALLSINFDGLSWRAAVVLVISVIVRWFTSPTAEVKQALEVDEDVIVALIDNLQHTAQESYERGKVDTVDYLSALPAQSGGA